MTRKINMRLFLNFILVLLLIALLASLFFLPSLTPWISFAVFAVSIGIAFFLSVQKHWKAYRQAKCTREKMIRNLLLDLLGFLLTIGAAMYAGRLAGGYAGLRAGLWVGLLAGFTGGFLVSWLVKLAWQKLVSIVQTSSSTAPHQP